MSQSTPPAAGQVWDAQAYADHAGFVPDYGNDVLTLLDPKPQETILDLGCGDGSLTAHLIASGAHITGLEPDPSMAAAARVRGVSVLEQDAHAPFGETVYDAVFSNAALHWMRAPTQVLQNAHAALRPGGRFVAEQGGFGNVASIQIALAASLEVAGFGPPPAPWDFPTVETQQARLEAAGFRVTHIALFARPTPLPSGFQGWLRTLGPVLLRDVPAEAIPDILEETTKRLWPLVAPDQTCVADYVRLRFVAVKEH